MLKADLRLPIGEHWKVYRNTMGSIESLVDDPRMLIKSRMNSANSEENEENQNVDKNWVIVNVVHAIREADEPSAAGVVSPINLI